MAGTYQAGEQKLRPGVYRRYTNKKLYGVAGAMTGVFAIPVQADFGPTETVTMHTGVETIKELYGEGGTVKGAVNLFAGGAAKVYTYRLGTGGSKGSLQLGDSVNGDAAVMLRTKYPSDLTFYVSLRNKYNQENIREFVVYEGAVRKETLEYEMDETSDETAILTEIVNKKSKIFEAEKLSVESKHLADLNQVVITAGENPVISESMEDDYEKALQAFEPYKWNVLVADTVNSNIHLLFQAYMDRIKKDGAMGICVVGDTEKSLEDRMSAAKAFNSEYVIYVGSGYVDVEGKEIRGYEAVTMQAGVIGSTPANRSVVHTMIPNAVDTLEKLKKEDYIRGIEHGMLMLSPSESGEVWFDSGITTLTTLKGEQDPGWKKIRRVVTRCEMFDRIDRTISPLIGKVNCDEEGIANIIKVAKDVLIEMENEHKIRRGAEFYMDETYDLASDSVHFIVSVGDIDSLEKIYLNYQFSFSGE
jgi:hypothetical protein